MEHSFRALFSVICTVRVNKPTRNQDNRSVDRYLEQRPPDHARSRTAHGLAAVVGPKFKQIFSTSTFLDKRNKMAILRQRYELKDC